MLSADFPRLMWKLDKMPCLWVSFEESTCKPLLRHLNAVDIFLLLLKHGILTHIRSVHPLYIPICDFCWCFHFFQRLIDKVPWFCYSFLLYSCLVVTLITIWTDILKFSLGRRTLFLFTVGCSNLRKTYSFPLNRLF